MEGVLASVAIWTGGAVGLMKLLDFLLSRKAKLWLTDKAETTWLWLGEQRAGKFIGAVRSLRTQYWFSIATHGAMLAIICVFLGRRYLGWDVQASIQIGHPRIYEPQIFIDIGLLVVSALLVSRWVHPRIAAWVTRHPGLTRYYLRLLGASALSYLAMGAYLLAMFPVIGWDSPVFQFDDENQIRLAYEQQLGGPVGVYAIFIVSGLVAAPLMAEAFMLMTILFLSVYWLAFVAVLSSFSIVLRFVLLRVVESKEGPVLALSGVLIAAGAIAKAILGR